MLDEAQRTVLYKRVFESDDGKAVLVDLCKLYGVFLQDGTDDPTVVLMNTGARNVILAILERVFMGHDELMMLMAQRAVQRME